MGNSNLCRAKCAKNDEFYTRLEDVEAELRYYGKWFVGKVVYCNCDDYNTSNFYKYFSDNFQRLKLKKLITTNHGINPKCAVLSSEGLVVSDLNSGDFRSMECIEILKTADIVVTNPPFSLLREYIAQLIEYNKQFLIVGNLNAITYKNIFPLIQASKLWLGVNSNKTVEFKLSPDYKNYSRIDTDGNKFGKVPAITWYTNLEHNRRNEELILHKTYNSVAYPKYDNYNAIEISRVADIPTDYTGVMGVPITFLCKYNPNQFEILGCSFEYGKIPEHVSGTPYATILNNLVTYKRIFIKKIGVEYEQ